jgi:hypothetical protein
MNAALWSLDCDINYNDIGFTLGYPTSFKKLGH